jgi:dihydrofolate reductase
VIGLIVAFAKNHVIGNNGCIPWKIRGEQKWFKELTTGNIVVMGRSSYEEIGQPLPNRTTIVISRTKMFDEKNCITVKSLDEAIKLAGNKNIYISGGSSLYKEALSFVEKMYITEIDYEIEGDTFFPKFDETLFIRKEIQHFDGDIPYTYVTYTRK